MGMPFNGKTQGKGISGPVYEQGRNLRILPTAVCDKVRNQTWLEIIKCGFSWDKRIREAWHSLWAGSLISSSLKWSQAFIGIKSQRHIPAWEPSGTWRDLGIMWKPPNACVDLLESRRPQSNLQHKIYETVYLRSEDEMRKWAHVI